MCVADDICGGRHVRARISARIPLSASATLTIESDDICAADNPAPLLSSR